MNFDLETALEDALVVLLNQELSVNAVRWDDNFKKYLGDKGSTVDVVKVKATLITEETGTLNSFAGESIIVDIAVFATKKADLEARGANTVRGEIRNLVGQSDIVDRINSVGDITVYGNGVIPQGSFEATDEKNWGKGITVRVVAHPKI